MGIPLQTASAGPFAQFQNSDDSEDALTQLVIQLVKRIPNAEPDREVVKSQVSAFRSKATSMAVPVSDQARSAAETDAASVAKIFEEVKVMFKDLPARIESRVGPSGPPRRRRRHSARVIYELLDGVNRVPTGMELVVIGSQLRDDIPWLHELAVDTYRRMGSRGPGAYEALLGLEQMTQLHLHHPIFQDPACRGKEFEIEEMVALLRDMTARLLARYSPKPQPGTVVAPTASSGDSQAPNASIKPGNSDTEN
jgi:hypothetical protein